MLRPAMLCSGDSDLDCAMLLNLQDVVGGGTAINEYPFVRIDQIWHTDKLRPAVVWAKKSNSSDHRIVISDFTFVD